MSGASAGVAQAEPAITARAPGRLGRVIGRAGVYALLIAGGALYALPFLWMLSTSLKEPGAAIEFPPRWIPSPVVWGNYLRAWTVLPFGDFTRNSVVYALAALIGQLLS